jgi:hypothetical protein
MIYPNHRWLHLISQMIVNFVNRLGKKGGRRSLSILLIGVCSLIVGIGLAQANEPRLGTVDVVPDRHQLGQELYLENCATCHIGLPPAVFPSQTWLNLIQDPEHYGVEITPLLDPTRLVVWNYLRFFSRPILLEEAIPYRLTSSRYFKALHPKVELPNPLQMGSCVTCHPAAAQFNYRSLAPEWENAP